MQTFLPYPDYSESARCLDRQRLGKQRVEAFQILRSLHGITRGWMHHPAVKMWIGCECSLLDYIRAICGAWTDLGYQDTVCRLSIQQHEAFCPYCGVPKRPLWVGNDQFHSAHRAILLAKNPEWYSQFQWVEAPAFRTNGKWPYIWR